MHLDIFSDVAKDHRPEVLHSMIEKRLLEFHDAFDDACKGFIALLNASDQPLRRP